MEACHHHPLCFTLHSVFYTFQRMPKQRHIRMWWLSSTSYKKKNSGQIKHDNLPSVSHSTVPFTSFILKMASFVAHSSFLDTGSGALHILCHPFWPIRANPHHPLVSTKLTYETSNPLWKIISFTTNGGDNPKGKTKCTPWWRTSSFLKSLLNQSLIQSGWVCSTVQTWRATLTTNQ